MKRRNIAIAEVLSLAQRDTLSEKLADSLVGPIPESTPRQMPGMVWFAGKATAVVGMRRSGKTTFVHQLRRERLVQGARRDSLPFISLEDERLAGLGVEALTFLLEEYGRRFPDWRDSGGVLWCFDEVQLVPGWERFVRRLLDAGNCKVVVTGSSAALLSREIATALRGRAWEVPLYPFSFAEALSHAEKEVPDAGTASGAERARIERAFGDWLTAGGFPEAQGLDVASRQQLLRDYVDVAILRDVVERHNVTNLLGLRFLVRQLLGNAAGLFSVEKFYGALKSQGVAISKDTLHQLLAHLEDCFLVRTVWMESDSERQRMVNPRKAYPVDTGLISVYDRSGRANLGHALETAVLIELQRRRSLVTYVRTPGDHEVDFLARGADGQVELIQVCADAREPATSERELLALREAGERYPGAIKRLLILTRDAAPTFAAPDVIVQPAYAWMLARTG